ncbi:MAG: hypothetical protein J6K17_14430 [Oscillospiraceae bacterium]|nr:hypothetical protein [Oscillospiraceae bacterium]
MSIIKNREQVVDELTDMLVNFEKELNAYDTDVYAYFNTETKEVTLDTFVNPGGNSWLNDNSDTIYTDKQHNNSIFDSYDNEGDLLAAATNENKEKSEAIMNEIKKQIAEDEDIDIEDVSVSYFDIRDYIENNDELMENLSNAYSDLIDEMRPEYAEQAENIVDKYEEKLKEEHQIDTADISSPEKLCEIGFLNNGSAVMKLTYDDVEYVHNYDDMAQMARDYKDFMESPDTLSDWTEGNEPELWDDIYNDIAYLPYNSETDDISELNTDWGGNVSEFVSIINEANNDKSLSPDKEVEKDEPLFSKKKIMSDEFKPKSEKGKEDRSKSKNHNMEM